MNNRFRFGVGYLLAGLLLVLIVILSKGTEFVRIWMFLLISFMWCTAWSAIGVGAGLIMSRNLTGVNAQEISHLLGYYAFVLVVASVAAFNIAILNSGKEFPSTDLFSSIKFYGLSAFVGLIVGFIGDTLRDILVNRL